MSDTCKQRCHECHWWWIGRCMHTSHYGQDVSVVKDQPIDCESFITPEDWKKRYCPMKRKRAMELLNAVINHLSVAERNNTVIEKLLNIGFTDEELINEFNFCREDVNDVLKEMEKEDE